MAEQKKKVGEGTRGERRGPAAVIEGKERGNAFNLRTKMGEQDERSGGPKGYYICWDKKKKGTSPAIGVNTIAALRQGWEGRKFGCPR